MCSCNHHGPEATEHFPQIRYLSINMRASNSCCLCSPSNTPMHAVSALRNVVGKVSQMDADMSDPNRMHLVTGEAAAIEAIIDQYDV